MMSACVVVLQSHARSKIETREKIHNFQEKLSGSLKTACYQILVSNALLMRKVNVVRTKSNLITQSNWLLHWYDCTKDASKISKLVTILQCQHDRKLLRSVIPKTTEYGRFKAITDKIRKTRETKTKKLIHDILKSKVLVK